MWEAKEPGLGLSAVSAFQRFRPNSYTDANADAHQDTRSNGYSTPTQTKTPEPTDTPTPTNTPAQTPTSTPPPLGSTGPFLTFQMRYGDGSHVLYAVSPEGSQPQHLVTRHADYLMLPSISGEKELLVLMCDPQGESLTLSVHVVPVDGSAPHVVDALTVEGFATESLLPP